MTIGNFQDSFKQFIPVLVMHNLPLINTLYTVKISLHTSKLKYTVAAYTSRLSCSIAYNIIHT